MTHRAMAMNTKDKTMMGLIQYLHGCCFRPTPRTFLKAIKNGSFFTWTGLKNQQTSKPIPPNIETAPGHLDQERKDLQYPKNIKPEMEVKEDSNIYPEEEIVTTHEICATITPLNIKRKGFSDLTRFTTQVK